MPTILTPDRLSFLFILIGFAIFQTSRRNMKGYGVTAVSATLYAALEVLAQATVLGIVLYGFNTLASSIISGRWGGFIVLLIGVAICYKPLKQITSSIEKYLLGTYGERKNGS